MSQRALTIKARGQQGPLLKYSEPMLVYMQFRIPEYQKEWLLNSRTADVSMADIIRKLIDKEMNEKRG